MPNMGLIPTKECCEKIRQAFPVGAEVELIFMDDTWHSVPKGTRGRVRGVDGIGTIHVAWETNSSLGVVWNADIAKNVETGVMSNQFWDDYRPITTI